MIFDLRSENRIQAEQIESFEKDNNDLKLGLSDFKKSYYQVKKQLESSRVQKQAHSAISKSRVDELEEKVRGFEKLQQEHQLLMSRCNSMTKTISNLEQDVAIAQTVAKNFDELVQENFQLKENIENLQKSLVETFQPPAHTIDTPSASFVNDPPKSVLSCLEECSASPRASGTWLFSGPSANSRQLKELDRENRYLKRHIDKTWGQWDRVKSDLVALVEVASSDPIETSKRRLGQALTKMERYRPAKAYPNFKRASIQQILIDDRPAITSNEMTSTSSSSPSCFDNSSIAKPTTLPVFPSPLTYDNSSKGITPGSPPIAPEESKRQISISDCTSETGSVLDLNLTEADPSLTCPSETAHDSSSHLAAIDEATSTPEPASSRTSIPSYLARRANRKAGVRSIKKVSFMDLSSETLAQTPDAFGSQPPPSPLPTQPSVSETASSSSTSSRVTANPSEEASQSPLFSPNQLQIGDVPSHALLWRANHPPTSNRTSESDSNSQLTRENSTSESHALLVFYAIAAYFLTYWTSTQGSQKTITSSQESSQGPSSSKETHRTLRSSRNRTRSTTESRGLRHPTSPPPYVSDQEEGKSEAEEENGYGDNSLLLLKFWFEMLVMGGSNSKE
ncbi:hypothetical protein DSO57_1002759 [Entomophthora muscae]|uniref:Uncharacterized protein n=1 Tax=Entomophthora muscae TaxID=34485 RepID=A0ACC2RNS5_9FUNG|nr:hypothetical protein DSO57_1002759 [Entomophthora muscae]